MKELTVVAEVEELDRVIQFVNEELDAYGCDMAVTMQIDIAVEEIYVNIANYAYKPEDGNATIRCQVEEDPLRVTIEFLDQGKPYNPLLKEDPDVTLSAEERDIGGLGIYMVKNMMDDIQYEFKDGKNILTIKKTMEEIGK